MLIEALCLAVTIRFGDRFYRDRGYRAERRNHSVMKAIHQCRLLLCLEQKYVIGILADVFLQCCCCYVVMTSACKDIIFLITAALEHTFRSVMQWLLN